MDAGVTTVLGVAQSFSGRRWQMRDVDEAVVAAMARDHRLSPFVARLLVGRGVSNETAADFLQPTLKRLLPEPLSLADMEKAVARVIAALDQHEQIAIYGDYDVDGSCSAALLSDFLAAVGTRPRLYVPDRMTEGYGPNAPALLKLKAEGVSLVITVDCGAGAAGPLQAAADAGLDVVVLDHHACEVPPTAFAHVNPNKPGDTSGLGHLCATAIVFLFCVALNRHLRVAGRYQGATEPDLRDALDLVALATVCDVVPLIGVNRALVQSGLARLGAMKRPGVAALAAVAGVQPPFTTYHLGFVLGPRINAGGRVGRCGLGADLLTARDPAQATEYAQALDSHNRERQAIEKLILDEAMVAAELQADSPFILVSGDGWHPGVVGIVAGRLKERFHKPALVAGFEGGVGRGSARSVHGVNIGALIRAAQLAGVITAGGGHAMAAGFSLEPDQVEPLRAFLLAGFAEGGLETEVDAVTVEALVSAPAATPALISEIAKIGPFGAEAPEPMVALPEMRVSFADVVGKDHVRLRLAGGDGSRIDAIAFRIADTELGRKLMESRGATIHAVGRLSLNEWNGRVTVQLLLEDAAPAQAFA
ncbi:MAG: single-stranded-DNA-specific exonuclease RecJ [Rhizomicrobium sp.]